MTEYLANKTETDVEPAALVWFERLRYGVLSGPTIAPHMLKVGRGFYEKTVLEP
jgi:hypothetical protein